jgi:acyl-CoA synthetase (AMP-forming)/AMP-acid ligase II
MRLTAQDVLCCPPPLFHCFGLVLGLLAVITHGGTIVFPGESFDAAAVIKAVVDEGCTALHGVPAMWAAEMELIRPEHDFSRLRTGIAAGSATPRQMLEDLRQKLHLTEITNTYGMFNIPAGPANSNCLLERSD